eukprot:554334-Prymnesium_polylepis.1
MVHSKLLQPPQLTQLTRQRSTQQVVRQLKRRHSSGSAGSTTDAMPRTDWLFAEPTCIVGPARTVRGPVQRMSIGCPGCRSFRSACVFAGARHSLE